MRIFLSALGCRLNEAELELWARAFTDAGDTVTSQVSDADVIVMNTCAVTREAVAKSRRSLRRLQRNNPTAKLVVSGCYSELTSDSELADQGIDLVIPNVAKDQLVSRTRQAFADCAMPQTATQPAEFALFARNRHRAFIKIQDGCRYRCTFCIVTVARGAECSRPIPELVNDVQELSAQGVQEIVLTGVHVGGYGSDLDSSLYDLVKALLADTDIPRIRFASVEPWDLSTDFLDLFTNDRLMPHMHLPLQSGCDSVLRRMARRCRTADFNRLTSDLRQRIPHFNVTTDIITGFPGETEAEWQASLQFIESQAFGHIHIFTYSERQGTKAARLPDPVPIDIRRSRSRQLHDLAERMRANQLGNSIGQMVTVLCETGRRQEPEQPGSQANSTWLHQGYTPNYQRVMIKANRDLANSIIPVKLTAVKDGRLIGEALDAADDIALPSH